MQRSKKRARMKLQFNHLGRDDTACSGATPIDGGTMFQLAIAVNGEFSGSPKQWNRIPSPSKFVSEQITIFYEEEVSIDCKTREWRIFQLSLSFFSDVSGHCHRLRGIDKIAMIARLQNIISQATIDFTSTVNGRRRHSSKTMATIKRLDCCGDIILQRIIDFLDYCHLFSEEELEGDDAANNRLRSIFREFPPPKKLTIRRRRAENVFHSISNCERHRLLLLLFFSAQHLISIPHWVHHHLHLLTIQPGTFLE